MSERLSNDELNEAEQRAREWDVRDKSRDSAVNEELMALDVFALVDELRARRAADLKPEEVELLGELLEELRANDYGWEGGTADICAVLARLVESKP